MKKADKEKAIIKFLKSVELFQGLSLPGLKSILKHIEERTVRNHEFLFYKDEVSEHIFIIRYGEFIIESFSGQGNIYVGPGDVISENSLLLGTPHSASSYAMIDSLVYAIDGKAFMQIALKERRLSQNIMKLLSERMKENLDGFATSKKQIARRLFCHIPLDSIEDYKNKLESILEEASEIQTAPSILINISQFKGLSHEKFAETLSEIRKKTPLVHLFFESPELAMDLPSIVLQSDWIIFWEKEVNKNILAKENILSFWQKRIRNFNGRTVLFQSDPSILQPSNYSVNVSGEIFYKKFVYVDALARFLVSKTRGIALGGGGARALAHIGLLKVLQKEGLRFDYISGASFGAVIAALYARGDSIENMESLIRKFFGGIESTFDPTIPFVSFFKGKKMRKMLKDAFGDLRIEELPIPFVTSAVDLQSGKEYVFERGPIVEALTATMSLPGAFPPYFLGEKVLVDGGMVNNVPEDLLRARGADVVVGVNVSPLQETVSLKLFENRKASGTSIFRYLLDNIKYPPILKIMGRTITLEGREITRLKKLRMDLFINFHLDEFQLFDFVQYKNIIKKGEAETELNLKEINNLLLPNKTS
jgi:NTE family protein